MFPKSSPIISLIAALGKDHATVNHCVIGYENRMPWHLSADLRHFKALTMGKPVIMGRKTYQSIGKALPQRTNIVITGDPSFQAPDCQIVHSIEEAMTAADSVAEVMVIGGAKLYAQMLPYAQRLYLTLIHHDFKGDTFFPDWNRKKWQEIAREDCKADDKNDYDYSFVTYKRISID